MNTIRRSFPNGIRDRKGRAGRKHGVSFSEALNVFDDILAKIFCDSDRSEDEAREIIIGRSLTGTLPLVSFTERAPDRVLRVGRSTRQAGVFVTVG